MMTRRMKEGVVEGGRMEMKEDNEADVESGDECDDGKG